MNFRVEGFGEREFAGRIERINPAATAGSRSISVYAVIDNREGLLRGGMFAQGALTLSRVDNALAVPASAVREEIGQTFVYAIEDGAGEAQEREGRRAGRRRPGAGARRACRGRPHRARQPRLLAGGRGRPRCRVPQPVETANKK